MFSPGRGSGGLQIPGTQYMRSSRNSDPGGSPDGRDGRLRSLAVLARAWRAATVPAVFDVAAGTMENTPDDLPFAILYQTSETGLEAILSHAIRQMPGSPVAPRRIPLRPESEAVWPLGEVARTGRPRLMEDLDRRLAAQRGHQEAGRIRSAWVQPIIPPGKRDPAGFLVAGLNPERPFDDDYRSFLELAAHQVATAVGRIQDQRRDPKTVQAALEMREREFRALIENAPDIIARFDRQCRHLYVNPAITAVTGLRPRQFIGRTSREIGMPSDLCDQWEENIKAVFETGAERAFDFSFPGPRGRVHIHSRVVPEFGPDGSVESVLGVNHDITDFKMAEREQQKFRLIADNANDACALMDRDGNFPYVNRVMRERLGYTDEEFRRLRVPDVNPVFTEARYRTLFDRLEQEAVPPFETVHRRKDGSTFPVEVSLSVMDIDGEPHMFATIRDITDRRRAEQRRAELAARERAVHAEAEAARRRDAFLKEASDILTSSLEHQETLDRALRLALSAGIAEWCAFHILSDDDAILSTAVHLDAGIEEALVEAYRLHPPRLEEDYGVARAMKTRQTETVENIAAATGDHGGVERLHRLHGIAGLESAIVTPMLARGRVLGAISLIRSRPGSYFTPAEAELAQEFTRRCAIAVSNARLYQEAQEQRDALQTVLDSMTEGVISLDRDLLINESNISARWLLGATSDSLRGRRCGDVINLTDQIGQRTVDVDDLIRRSVADDHPVQIAEAWLELPTVMDGMRQHSTLQGSQLQPWPASRANGSPGDGVPGRTAGGTPRRSRRRLPVALTVAPRHSARHAATGAVVLFRDISQRREVDELREDIISLVSHELRTPLLHIKGFASSLLETDVDWDDETRTDFIRTIDQESDRLTRLVEDLLEMSRLANDRVPLHRQQVPPAALVRNGVNSAEPFLKDRQLVIDVQEDLPQVSIDAGRVETVLVNLLENAAKYSPAGSRIGVSAYASGPEVIFSVLDEGVGIPAESLEAVFEKFTRLQIPGVSQPPGTGLGLALCRVMVESHGGRIWVESEVGHGSTFFFALPAGTRGRAQSR